MKNRHATVSNGDIDVQERAKGRSYVESNSRPSSIVSSHHTARLEHRQATLSDVFTVRNMESAWKKYVKQGMRSQYWLDLHDNYDFHRNIRERLTQLRQDIRKGNYKPAPPLFLRLEKSNGICRRIAVPSAEDAVVLQTVVEKIAPHILNMQPSENAFYSRSHKANLPRINFEIDYVWFVQYRKFVKKLERITDAYPYLIVADVANYFDNIDLKSLRNVVSSLTGMGEDILDFLFFCLEGFSWRPDYLPPTGSGLPQVDFDAPRLLGHAFLFEIDKDLASMTDDVFVRWMDDIDIPSKSEEEAKVLLCRLDELLMTRG
ncbi:RNA-directed DNA polymerase [Azospirillum rugosum]|uniref:Reverse transcriptase (RNA-dependent DNA polymerase) n=1 Tax=Azospirillum rugosum TaxID=416170 RepID=A0ABS4SPN0_9PROT|nr:RNA-directed DNA polymerase [Azospirillum rugosum]MBP2294508.1 hypothetical protein [Azospirillum rugosum]MDQ0529013.1 hypothetical protein [Azospirillum rugosum]